MVETVDLTPVDHMEVAIGAEKAKPSLRMVFNCLGKTSLDNPSRSQTKCVYVMCVQLYTCVLA